MEKALFFLSSAEGANTKPSADVPAAGFYSFNGSDSVQHQSEVRRNMKNKKKVCGILYRNVFLMSSTLCGIFFLSIKHNTHLLLELFVLCNFTAIKFKGFIWVFYD